MEEVTFDEKQLDNLISEYEAAEKVSTELTNLNLATVSETLTVDDPLRGIISSLAKRQLNTIQLGLEHARLVKKMVELGAEGEDEEGEEGDEEEEELGSMLMVPDSDQILGVLEGYVTILERTIADLQPGEKLTEFTRLLYRARLSIELVRSITIEPEPEDATS